MAQTILVVEDEDTLRDELSYQLEQEGYRVVRASDGAEALNRFRKEKPDLILLDLMLPIMSGVEVTRVVRRESDVPILILTARDSEVDKVVGLELGADDYVTKPFSLRELQARIRVLLRRSQRLEPPLVGLIESHDLRVSADERRAWRGAEELRLRPQEFDLLAFLMRNRGIALSR